MADVSIRPAAPGDLPAIHRLLTNFGAHWERPEWVTATPVALDAALFGTDHKGFAHVAERDGNVVGAALWYLTYNFWMATPILFLEDLYVDEAARGSGAGEGLMRALADEAVVRDCAWMDWIVRVDNIAGQRFYARHGGALEADFGLWRMERDALIRLAGGADDR